jgi:hypothetical protein
MISGVSSFSFAADTFTSTYTNYRIMISQLYGAAPGNGVRLRLRKAGSDNSDASSYRSRGFRAASSLALETATTNELVFTIVNDTATVPTAGFIDVFQPKVSMQTNFVSSFFSGDIEGAFVVNARHTTVDTFDSMTIYSGTNLNGTYSVYGYNK